MTFTRVEISCPHCHRVYRLRIDLRTLAGTRSTARCGRCGRRFSLTKRVHDSGVMASPLGQAARDSSLERAPSARSSRRPPRDTNPSAPPVTLPEPPPLPPSDPFGSAASQPPRARYEAPRRMATTSPENRGGGLDRTIAYHDTTPPPEAPDAVGGSLAEPLGSGSEHTRYPSEPPPRDEPLAGRRGGTQPQMPAFRSTPPQLWKSEAPTQPSMPRVDAGREAQRASALDDELRGSVAGARAELQSKNAAKTLSNGLVHLDEVGAQAPVGEDVDELAPLEVGDSGDELTPVPSEASVSPWAMDPDEWVARADPGVDALSAAHSEGAVALHWLLVEDRAIR